MKKTQVVIIGGGLAGLTCAWQLARQGVEVILVEKKEYPFHRVCGEYISNEVRPFLERQEIFPLQFNPPLINKLLLTSTNGESARLELKLGGFGISRFTFDHFLYEKISGQGVQIITRKYVKSVNFHSDQFEVELNDHQKINCSIVVGAFGKRSTLDKFLKRPFIERKSPYVGVKYHLKGAFPENEIALHNFNGGYAGISGIEEGKLNLCYLASRIALKRLGDLKALEEKVLMKNPFLRDVFYNFDFLFEQPEVINEISFETKRPVESHILMCGDSAGMITPLCGNGMAMAIHASSIASELIFEFLKKRNYSRNQLESDYVRLWSEQFSRRLWTGRHLQRLFGNNRTSTLAVSLAKRARPVAQYLVNLTHGRPF
ncbi:MAG: FAD-dependent oxidoreductase [Cyclobacteriaceae bacterium]|nr:MAG: FAD-dependent oxidoreductase [Cyclobacteriaceae bacterium]